MALVVAFLPTTKGEHATAAEQIVGTLHQLCAGSLFIVLGTFAGYFFRKSDGHPTEQRNKRNKVYVTCAAVIGACLLAIIASEIFHPPASWDLLFFFETLMVWAFAVSWLVKGGFPRRLADKP
jgi:hypothetical protein